MLLIRTKRAFARYYEFKHYVTLLTDKSIFYSSSSHLTPASYPEVKPPAEADVNEGAQVTGDGGDAGEEVGPLLDRHVQHVGDRLALEVHLERLAVVAGAVADLARHVDVGQEVHLDLDRAVTGARLAAPALDVEGEPTLLVAADLGLGRGREQGADAVEHAGVGGRVGTRSPTDGRLVDVDDLVDLVEAVDAAVPSGDGARVVDVLGQGGVEDVVDDRRLARARDPGDRAEDAQREVHVDVLEVVLPRSPHDELAAGRARAAYVGDRDHLAAGEVHAGRGVVVLEELAHGPRHDHLATVLARARTDVDDPVGHPDGVLVVLDDDQGVAQVLEPDQGLDQPVVVSLVQPDRGLVQDVEDAHQPRADLGGQPDPLGLAPGQRPRRPVEGQVVQADVEQEVQSLLDLLEHPLGDLPLAGRQLEGP